ncbi:GGDEF domain-containing protein [Bordetella genomosp. 11]|uniref:diguanylate cyclase n=1 Tax=Bordetella genomosp. 11 TaxID=1416808 RepID=A0A261V0W7_9BORD|nr:GGDEF domain-containing protein [Bordetella genomosp. 11]OZI67242.1 GGDEF domain-containing protein [Bordetella genomosp. 11]
MHFDLLTLYFLAIGTLFASAGMTFWEHRSNPRRGATLRILAAGYATLGIGCASVFFRGALPAPAGFAISNLVILSGYLLILGGVGSLSGRRYRGASAVLLMAAALMWAVGGARWQDVVWNYLSAAPIAIASGLTAWEMMRCQAMAALPSRYVVVALAGLHALVYAVRVVLLPALVAAYGAATQSIASQITMLEGVLYSVVLPMALLKLIRDETHGQLLRESQTDYLTRLGNRRWFFEEGARIMGDGQRYGPVAVLAFDLDQFKAINDLHGHHIGDRVLKSFAETARAVLGADAILARIGGEEFAALLSGKDAVDARELGEAVAKRFADAAVDKVDSHGIPATVSIGLAYFESGIPPLPDALAAADRALYRAKSLGGNRLELARAAGAAAE